MCRRQVCDFSLGRRAWIIRIDYMTNPATDPLSLSGYASLNRADLTHQPKDRPFWTRRITNVLIVGVIAVGTIFVLFTAR